MRHMRDAVEVVVCDGCYKVVQITKPVEIKGRTYDACSDDCEVVIQNRFPLPHRKPEEVWESEGRAADVGKVIE